MRTLAKPLVVAALMTAFGAVPAAASLRHDYLTTYQRVAHRFGPRTPGRNIVLYGIRGTHDRRATDHEIAVSLRRLRAMLAPVAVRQAPAPVVTSTPLSVAQAPAQSYQPQSSSSGGSTNAYVNPNCESGGNPQAVSPSGQYWGKYQFDRSTWAASGGNPADYGSAPASEQDQVAANVHYDAWPNC